MLNRVAKNFYIRICGKSHLKRDHEEDENDDGRGHRADDIQTVDEAVEELLSAAFAGGGPHQHGEVRQMVTFADRHRRIAKFHLTALIRPGPGFEVPKGAHGVAHINFQMTQDDPHRAHEFDVSARTAQRGGNYSRIEDESVEAIIRGRS